MGANLSFKLSSSSLLRSRFCFFLPNLSLSLRLVMPLPFEELQGLGFSYGTREDLCCVVGVNNGSSEPTSVLDSSRSPSPFLSSSTTTLSSSHGGPGGAAAGKCNQMAFEDLDGVLSGSPGQEQSIFRLIMSGDVVDPGSEFMGFDPGSGSDPNPLFGYGFPLDEPPPEEEDLKFQITTNPNPCFFSGGSSPPAKRLNSGQPVSHQWGFPFSDPGHPFLAPPPKLAGTETTAVITEQLFNAAGELTGTDNNNPVLAQGILARLNQNLNNNLNNPKPPFQRAALYVTESLQSLLQPSLPPPHTLLLKIAAYRAFSETSPFLQFVNFTANQTILESLERFDRIRIVDFDVGFGGQWSSLIQELANRSSSAPLSSLKITSFSSPSTVSDKFELRFTEENLRAFAGETGVTFEMEMLNMETLLNPPLSLLRSSDKEAIAVNLPISSVISGYLPLILRFLKQISPNVVVCSDTIPDAPFPNAVVDALHYYTSLLESLESPNSSSQEAVASIERFCVQPWIQRLLTNRYRWMDKSPPWRSLFGQCGFTSVAMSQTAETQAEYLLQRNPMRGFHLEKRQSSSFTTSSLVLCWQKKVLVAVSAWKC